MTDLDLDHLERLLAEAPQLPLHVDTDTYGDGDVSVDLVSEGTAFLFCCGTGIDATPLGYQQALTTPEHKLAELLCALHNSAPALIAAARRGTEADPIPMVLHCPKCGHQHIDAPEPENGWTNPPHRKHLCHGCGNLWRPTLVHTVGVAALPEGDDHE